MIASAALLSALVLIQIEPPEGPKSTLQVPSRAEFRAAVIAVDDGAGWVLELYDIRDLTEGEGPLPLRSAEDLVRLVLDNLALEQGQVKLVAGTLVVRANPADHHRLRSFLMDLRTFIAPCDVTSMVGTLVREPGSGADEGAGLGGVKILTLSGAEVSSIEAARHASTGRVDLSTHVGSSSWDVNFVNATARSHGPVKEGEPILAGNAIDRVWLVGHDLVTSVEGHPGGVLVPKLETLSEGVVLEASYRMVGTGPDAGRMKVTVDARQSRVVRPVATRTTPSGVIHVPESETATISATLLLESGGGFLVVFEATEKGVPEEAVLVTIVYNG